MSPTACRARRPGCRAARPRRGCARSAGPSRGDARGRSPAAGPRRRRRRRPRARRRRRAARTDTVRCGRPANACSTAFCTSSVSTSDSGVATSAASTPKLPSRTTATALCGAATSAHIASTRSATASKATRSSSVSDSVSCTSAMLDTRRTDSSSALRDAGSVMRRACSRSSAATVCRLFFTRWWISRIVASLPMSCRSRRRSSVTSRTSTRAPRRCPAGTSGIARSSTVAPCASTSLSRGSAKRSAAASAADARGSSSAADEVSRATVRPEVLAEQVPGHAEPAVGRQRVGARVDDVAGAVEPQQAVADARRVLRVDLARDRVGERALRDHLQQLARAGQVRELERARASARSRRCRG